MVGLCRVPWCPAARGPADPAHQCVPNQVAGRRSDFRRLANNIVPSRCATTPPPHEFIRTRPCRAVPCRTLPPFLPLFSPTNSVATSSIASKLLQHAHVGFYPPVRPWIYLINFERQTATCFCARSKAEEKNNYLWLNRVCPLKDL